MLAQDNPLLHRRGSNQDTRPHFGNTTLASPLIVVLIVMNPVFAWYIVQV